MVTQKDTCDIKGGQGREKNKRSGYKVAAGIYAVVLAIAFRNNVK
jgi:hypothetical protein